MPELKKQLNVLAVEAIAIVVSILLAFSIDAWWSNYKDRQKGDEYAARIEGELEGIREVLHMHRRSIDRKIAASESVEDFFSGVNRELSPNLLISSLYNMGRDRFETFDTTTFDDLISSGQFVLVADTELRAAIRLAYQRTFDVEPDLWPYRDEYLKGIRAWIPQDTIDVIRIACPSMIVPDDEYRCEPAELDEEVAKELANRYAKDVATLAYRLRKQGLIATGNFVDEALEAVETALAIIENE